MSKADTSQDDTAESHAFRLLGAAPFLLQAGTFTWPDPALCRALLRINADAPPITVKDWAQRLTPEDNHKRQKAIKSLTWNGAQYALRYLITLDDARRIWVEERGERQKGDGAIPTEISGVIINIDSTVQAQDRAAYLAVHDDLTGLWNAPRFQVALESFIAFAQAADVRGLCLRLHITNLADINKTYGYDQGDRLLKCIAARLKETLKAPDIAARIRGAEFGVALYTGAKKTSAAIAAQLQEALSGAAYNSPHGPLKAEVKIAYTALGSQAQTASQALSQTTLALKNGQKNQDAIIGFETVNTPVKDDFNQKDFAAEDILSALNDRRISLAFQPIIDAKTRQLHHYECLLRLRQEAGEIISAGRFIVASERLGLVHLLDRRALELAAEALRVHPDIHIALNVSAGTVQKSDTAKAYMAALKALGPDAQRVSLELTETIALEDPAMASQFSEEARALGCDFAIDDFGSGYTTFQNLMTIEAEMIKIDGSFIEGIARTPYKETFVRMMVDLAQTFGVKTVAEMVDSRADAELLERLGVDYLQGYMFGIPSAAPAWRQAS